MAVKKKPPTFTEQYEQIKQSRSESSLSREEYIAKRLRETEELEPQHPTQIDWVETMSLEKKPKDLLQDDSVQGPEKKKSRASREEEAPVSPPVRRKSLVLKYTVSIGNLSERERVVLEFLYFAEYNPFQLCVGLICDRLKMERSLVRAAIVKLAKSGLIKFEGFMTGKNNPVRIEQVISVRNFLIENPSWKDS